MGEGGGKLREEGEGGNSFLPLCPLEGLWPTTRVKRNSSTYTYIYIPGVHLWTCKSCDRGYVQGVSSRRGNSRLVDEAF